MMSNDMIFLYNLLQRLGVTFDVHEWESDQHVRAKALCQRLIDEGKLKEL